MRPLPPYNFRPAKRAAEARTGAGAPGSVRVLAESLSKDMSVRSGRLSVKPEGNREKPQLKVLGRE
jgi:hypothetical protein